jgi:hypothetical protein
VIGAFAVAATPNPSPATIWLVGSIVAILTALVGVLNWRVASKAQRGTQRISLSEDQLNWTKQAMEEAREAKVDAAAAITQAKAAELSAAAAGRSAESATRRADAAEERLTSMLALMDGLVSWTEKVISAANDPSISDADVRNLYVNGGPPELTRARLQIRRGR